MDISTQDDHIKIVHEPNKLGFWSYAWSFMGGLSTRYLIKNELENLLKRPPLPNASSITDLFKGSHWKGVGKALKNPEVLSDLGKEAALEGAAFLPGALIGYWSLQAALDKINPPQAVLIKPEVTAAQPQLSVTKAKSDGTLIAVQKENAL